MHPMEIRELLRIRPFQPLRVYISDGATYDIPHPELMMVSRTQVVIALGGGDGDLPERFAYCDPLHITRIEPLHDGKPRRKPNRRKKKP